MKCRFKIQAFIFLLVLLANTYSKANANPRIIPGGQSFNRGGVQFIEDAIIKFDTLQLSKSRLNRLEDAYLTWKNEDPSRKDIQMAGFCFVPILERQANSTASIYHFVTIGYRIVLTLWIPREAQESGTEKTQMDSMGFLGFSRFMDVFDPYIRPSRYLDSILFQGSRGVLNSSDISSARTYADELIGRTRECDLTFLDYSTYKYLTESTDYYSVSEKTLKDRRGIILMRSVNTPMGEDEQNNFSGLYLRSLLFRPMPLPDLQSFASKASIAFKFGGNCPPYWYLEEKGDVIGQEKVQPAQSSLMTLIPKKESLWDKGWFRIPIFVFALLGFLFALFLGGGSVRKTVAGIFGWEVVVKSKA